MHPVPYWLSDRDYFPPRNPRRVKHVAEIEAQERINQRIVAGSSDGSYSVLLTKQEGLK